MSSEEEETFSEEEISSNVLLYNQKMNRKKVPLKLFELQLRKKMSLTHMVIVEKEGERASEETTLLITVY